MATTATTTSKSSAPTSPSSEKEKPELAWVVKSCEAYATEYSDCRKFGARFNQYFVRGELEDCSGWKKDLENCKKWEKSEDIEALKKVIESEKIRIRERLQGHYNNDIWESRKEPLSKEEWSPPLPTHIIKGYENSFLKKKADALQAGEETLGDVDKNIRNERVFDGDRAYMCSIV